MAIAHVTRAEAKALGVDVPASSRSSRRTARAPYHTRCMTCGAVFTTQASEDRHVDIVGGHVRFELVLEYDRAALIDRLGREASERHAAVLDALGEL